MLPTQNRLRRSADVGRVRHQGQRWQHPMVVLFAYRQPQESSSTSRFAFAVGRYIGKASRRNRVKRRLREIVRQHIDQLEPGFDCLFVARPAAVTATYQDLEGAIVQLLANSRVISADRTNTETEGRRS